MIKKFENFNLPFTFEEIKDFIVDFIDSDTISIGEVDQKFVNQQVRFLEQIIYFRGKEIDRYETAIKKSDLSSPGIYLKINVYHPKFSIRGNLDLYGYTYSTLKSVFRRFIKYSNNASIFVSTIRTDKYENPLSENIIKIEFVD